MSGIFPINIEPALKVLIGPNINCVWLEYLRKAH